jgi:hypothetical protein
VTWVTREGGWRDANETGWPRYDGKVGSAVAGRLRGAASEAKAQRRRQDVVPKARKALLGRTNARAAGQAAAAAAAAAARGQISLYSPPFLLFSSSPA